MNKSNEAIHKIKRKLPEAVKRDIQHIDSLPDQVERKGKKFPLNRREQKLMWVIRTVPDQQRQMYREDINSCSDRIVNLHQPHVRPIPRGKAGAKTEFGSKL